jgi:hypothetical protein
VSALDIRKLLTLVETTKSEMGRQVDPPTRKAAALAVITNPFAGRDSGDLSALIDIGDELGALLGQMAVSALGVAPSAVILDRAQHSAGRDLLDSVRKGDLPGSACHHRRTDPYRSLSQHAACDRAAGDREAIIRHRSLNNLSAVARCNRAPPAGGRCPTSMSL